MIARECTRKGISAQEIDFKEGMHLQNRNGDTDAKI